MSRDALRARAVAYRRAILIDKAISGTVCVDGEPLTTVELIAFNFTDSEVEAIK